MVSFDFKNGKRDDVGSFRRLPGTALSLKCRLPRREDALFLVNESRLAQAKPRPAVQMPDIANNVEPLQKSDFEVHTLKDGRQPEGKQRRSSHITATYAPIEKQ